MKENSHRMQSYTRIENILKKHVNIKKDNISWDLMIIRDSIRSCDYFDNRREDIKKELPKSNLQFNFDNYTVDKMIEYLEYEKNCENSLDLIDLQVDYAKVNFYKNLIRLLKGNE